MGKERHNKFISVLLLALFLSYNVGITMFVHIHIIDGVAVTHSHPFTSSNHSHTSSQLVVIGQLSSFQGLESSVSNEIAVFHNGEEELNFDNHKLNVINACVDHAMLRAPPSDCLSL